MGQQVVVKGLLISYELWAKEQGGKTLLFLHGWRGQKEVWDNSINKLSNYHIYALDLPGFGQSQIPKQSMAVGDYAEVVAEFIKKLDLKNVVIVGHSFGGRVGIKLASTHANLIGKLVLVDSAGFAMHGSKKTAMNLAAKMAKPFFKPKFMQGLRKKIYQSMGSEDYVASSGVMTEIYLRTISEDLSQDMGQIICPTLVVWGEQDTVTPVEFGQKMHQLITASQLTILPGAGHFSFLDKPEEFVKILEKFVSDANE